MTAPPLIRQWNAVRRRLNPPLQEPLLLPKQFLTSLTCLITHHCCKISSWINSFFHLYNFFQLFKFFITSVLWTLKINRIKLIKFWKDYKMSNRLIKTGSRITEPRRTKRVRVIKAKVRIKINGSSYRAVTISFHSCTCRL